MIDRGPGFPPSTLCFRTSENVAACARVRARKCRVYSNSHIARKPRKQDFTVAIVIFSLPLFIKRS